jgi:hypothetical protein
MKMLIAASLMVACSGMAVTTAARASQPTAQPPVEYFHNGRSAPPIFGMETFNPDVYAPTVSPGTANGANFPTERSHGRT